jgi:hypothetical protein
MTGRAMRGHPFLRAYMAGVLLPTWFLPIVLAAFLIAHFTGHAPAGLERAMIFPMAVVPNLWGIWNALYLALGLRQRVPIGIFGALLPVLLVPAGVALAAALDWRFYTLRDAGVALPVAMAVYYLAWKYGVGYLNRTVEVR